MRRLNLTFHGLGEAPARAPAGELAVWVEPGDFRASLDLVGRAPNVSITFDDGNRSDLDVALPALLERGLAATFFVVAQRLGDPDYLGADDLRQLVHEGMRVGSHGLAHVDWRTLDDETLADDLASSRRELERVVMTRVDEAACPFGSYDRRVLAAVRLAGYSRVYTSDGGWARSESWFQPRNTLRRGSAAATTKRLIGGPTLIARLADPLRRTAKRLR